MRSLRVRLAGSEGLRLRTQKPPKSPLPYTQTYGTAQPPNAKPSCLPFLEEGPVTLVTNRPESALSPLWRADLKQQSRTYAASLQRPVTKSEDGRALLYSQNTPQLKAYATFDTKNKGTRNKAGEGLVDVPSKTLATNNSVSFSARRAISSVQLRTARYGHQRAHNYWPVAQGNQHRSTCVPLWLLHKVKTTAKDQHHSGVPHLNCNGDWHNARTRIFTLHKPQATADCPFHYLNYFHYHYHHHHYHYYCYFYC